MSLRKEISERIYVPSERHLRAGSLAEEDDGKTDDNEEER